MNNDTKDSKRVLPNTSRVCDKIKEYYEKFGQDRDLEKFMRFYSSASSQESQKTQDCVSSLVSSNSCEALVLRPNRPLDVCNATNSQSLPNIDVHIHAISDKVLSSPNNDIMDINIEAEAKQEKINNTSSKDIKTPKKTFKSTKTQTPESVAKTHRRLEWDSLGDVGYKKSVSTSNISTIEKSLLREFFKEKNFTSDPDTSPSREHITKESVQKLLVSQIEHNTPPLACSTLVVTPTSGAKPKMISQSTSSTSLYEKLEKYAQTSFAKPRAVRSQEIQCTISSCNSVIGGTATPSSFEYYSSRSSKSSDLLINSNTQKQINPLEHPFINSITDLLMKRKALGEKNQQKHHQHDNIRQAKFNTVLDDNKENQSHSTADSSNITTFSLSKKAPELDLGIQLICSLIDAKSVNGRQKKQLISDIIKRITHLETKDPNNSTAVSSSGYTATNSSDSLHQHVYDSIRSNIKNENNSQEISSMSTTNRNENFKVAKEPRNHVESMPSNFSNSYLLQQHQDKRDCKQKDVCENSHKEYNIKVSNVTPTAVKKGIQSDLIIFEQSKGKGKEMATNRKLDPEALEAKHLKIAKENKINRSTQTSKPSTTTTSAATTTPDLTTQKFISSINNESNNSNTETEQHTMGDWLNPLTQSEIEYEEKKQIKMKETAAAQQAKSKEKTKHVCGRGQQINWIENEIKRLECLKHLLLNDKTTTNNLKCSPNIDTSLNKDLNKCSGPTDKLYDTVYSAKSLVSSENAEHLLEEIEIVLEESQEAFINLKDNTKRTKDRKKETHIMYEKQEDSLQKNKAKAKPKLKPKPKFRIINENINFHEEQLLNSKKTDINRGQQQQQQQREKIDTPSTDKSQESESLRDLVQQRKREFMEAYRSKKLHHYKTLKQQQKEDYKYLNIQNRLSEKTTATTTTTSANTNSEHYSVPHTLTRKYCSNDNISYYTQHPLPVTPSSKEPKLKHHNPLNEHVVYTTTSAGQQQSVKPKSHESINTISDNTNNTATTSTSSMFCMSSDISVPMGTQNSSSTPTTTHQYDDVAKAITVAGVSVQTSDSILRSRPIYGPKSSLNTLIPNATTTTNTACIQVKPKGIAYVIEFDDNESEIINSASSDNRKKSNDMQTKTNTNTNSNSQSQHSSTKEITNNMKPLLLPTEQLLTLQDHLEKSKPTFLQHSKERKAILNKLQSMRQERDRQLREIIENTSMNSLDKRLQYLPPPPIQKVRILNTKQMKALTNKRFASLPEILAKNEREIEQKKRRNNRILRDIFNRRLQKRVHSGKISLNHSKTVI